MKLMAQNNFLNKSNSTLLQLTSVDTPQKSSTFAVIEDSALSLLFSPFLIYGTIILFFAIFLGGLLYQIKSQTFEMKRMISTLLVAILVGSIPFTLKTALQVTSISSRAGPDEVPHSIEMQTLTSSSVVITWETQAEKTGAVRVSRVPFDEKLGKMYIGDLGKQVKKHTVKVEGLEVGVQYEMKILSGSTWYDNNGEPLRLKI